MYNGRIVCILFTRRIVAKEVMSCGSFWGPITPDSS
jgi:hypothetical protein